MIHPLPPVVPPVILPCTSTIGKSSIILLMWKWMMRKALEVAEKPLHTTMTYNDSIHEGWFIMVLVTLIAKFILSICSRITPIAAANRRNRRDTVLMYIWRVGQVKLRSFIYFVHLGLNWCGMSCSTIVLWSRIHVDPHVVFLQNWPILNPPSIVPHFNAVPMPQAKFVPFWVPMLSKFRRYQIWLWTNRRKHMKGPKKSRASESSWQIDGPAGL